PRSWLEARKYAVLIDAGSSGSRMQVYSWKDPKLDRAMRESKGLDVKTLPKVEKGTWEGSGLDWTYKVEPGLSSFAQNPAGVAGYLKPLMERAESIVPQSAWADTPIYIMATAGMRLLTDVERNGILNQACQYVKQHTSFRLDGTGNCENHIQVISGEEEGLLGWISINYLMDGFQIRSKSLIETGNQGKAAAEGKSTFGFLDMGGASTQIAFEPSKKAMEKQGYEAAKEDLKPVVLRMLDGTQVTHNVFVTTFLGFGTNQARERYVHELMSNGGAGLESVATLGDGSKVKLTTDPCLPRGLQLTDPATKSSLVGTGSFTSCLESTQPLLDKGATCSHPPCLFHGVHVPPIDFSVNHFIGVSEYWFSSNDIFGQGGVYDYVSFQKAAVDFCGKPWEELKSSLDAGGVFGPQVELNRLQMQCFKAAWMVTVLHEGIGLPRIVDHKGEGDGKDHTVEAQDKADAKNLFQSVNDVDGFSVSWTLGKAVLEASKEILPAPGTAAAAAPLPHVADAGQAAAVDKAGAWNKWKPSWSSAVEGGKLPSIHAGKEALNPAPLAAVILVFLFAFLTCVCTRGRGPRASRRRAAIKEMLPPPFGTCGGLLGGKRAGRGDYILASMEEANESDKVAEFTNYKPGPEVDGEYYLSGSEGSSEDGRLMSPRIKLHVRKGSSDGGILSTVTSPLRRAIKGVSGLVPTLAWARSRSMGRRDPPLMSATPRNSPGLPSVSGRMPVRKGASSPPFGSNRSSRPASPAFVTLTSGLLGSSISRPASRTASRAPTPTFGARSVSTT
ncbi:hypothetical protein IE53DRAFT_299475, partial [Violaceomyces palustris]